MECFIEHKQEFLTELFLFDRNYSLKTFEDEDKLPYWVAFLCIERGDCHVDM
ncbi:hypothetical protein DFO70_13410 [Cytobacillus firmus]|uniref:Uncharacterized protein n=2 Tax=Cytobacillus TaxID=2675230 RepID=A0A366JGF7_CYTFI|nr:hypothetical protein DFO70_13410 [Cytobacillus firmus]TDX35405.1 hypothetical protein DFO72_13010 [Cytobacillus oceanisediminis]